MFPGIGGFGSGGVPAGGGGAAVSTAVDLSSGSVLPDPGSYIDTRSSTSITTTTNGSGTNTNVSTFAYIDLEGATDDGLYTWELERTNAGQNDKTGMILGFFDSASFSRSCMAGIMETTSVRALDRADGTTIQPTNNNLIAKCKVQIRLSTNEDGNRVIGPGWIDTYAADDTLLETDELAAHIVSGTLRKVAGIRRGTSGAPAGTFDYTLTESQAAL
jgi:hypothetical protein